MKRASLKIFLVYSLSWLTAVSLGSYFRLYPLLYRPGSDANEKASVLVLAKLRASVVRQINAKFPQLTQTEKDRLSKQWFDRLIRDEKQKVRASIVKVSREIGATAVGQDKDVAPYLLEADPYYYFELTENIVRTGKISDTVKGSKYLNKFMLAPEGHWEPFNIHPYLGYFIFKILSFLNPKTTLMYAVSFTPLVVTALALIPFFGICHILGCRVWASFLGSIFFVLSPVFLNRSAFGWYDNDPYNIFFPLIVFLFFFLGLTKNTKPKRIVFAILCMALITLYALFWQGWVYLLSIIFLSSIAIVAYNHFVLKKKRDTKGFLRYLAAINLGTFLGVSVIFGIKDFFVLFEEGWQALRNFLTPQLTLWPDVFISVGELRKSSLASLIPLEGGWLFFIISLCGLLLFALKSLRRPDAATTSAPRFIALFLLWTFCLAIALKAQRFAILWLTPLSLLFSLGLNYLYALLKDTVERSSVLSRYKNTLFYIIIGICTLLFIILPIRQAHETALTLQPIFNTTWDKALLKIKNETPTNSIVNSWWPPGHFISAIAGRRVTFDGATSNNPQAYWMADVFLASDEQHALGLIRMLNNSANQAAEYLQKAGIKLSVAVDMLKKITKLDRPRAKTALRTLLSDNQCEHLLNLTHATPPPSYILIYNDLVEKNLELSFIGRWDFSRIEKINSDKNTLALIPRRDSTEYIKFLWELVGGPLNYSEILAQINKSDDTILFDQDITVNLRDMTCRLASKKFGTGIPWSIIYDNGRDVVEKKLDGSTLSFSVLIFKRNNIYNCLALDRRLAHSLLFRLYFFQGKGLKYFQPFTQETDLTGRTQIYIYRIDWGSFLDDLGRP